jgi:hypothetical protein
MNVNVAHSEDNGDWNHSLEFSVKYLKFVLALGGSSHCIQKFTRWKALRTVHFIIHH